MPYRTAALAVRDDPTCVEKLAQLFPNAAPLQIPVRLWTVSRGRRRLHEQTIIEFGTAHEALFGSGLPLEFEDRIRMVTSDRSLDVRATVVAVRYHAGRKAVAARFIDEAANWVVRP